MNKTVQILIPDELKRPMGGMGEQARNIITAFPDGYHFDVIGSANGKEISGKNFKFHPVMSISNHCGNPDPLTSTFLNQALFVEKSRELKRPDLIHAFDWSTFWAGRILAKHYGIPLVVTIQLSIEKMIDNPHQAQQANYDMACSLEFAGMLDADVIVHVSNAYAKTFNSIFNSKSTVIENGIDLSGWVKKRDCILPGNRKNKKLVYIGRFAEMKNIVSLLKADIPEGLDVVFIGGNRGSSPELQDMVIEHSRARGDVYYAGSEYGQEKIDMLMAADAVIVPSTHEPFGIVALEALASKSILLSSFVGGMGDFLNEDVAINCGITPETISAGLNKFMALNGSDINERIKGGLEICKKYSWKTQSEKLDNVYNFILEKKNVSKSN